MNKNKLQAMIDTYENGNKSRFREELEALNPGEVATLISIWQPYHRSITAIQLSWDIIDK